MSHEYVSVQFQTSVTIRDLETKEVLAKASNRIHPQNMSRIIARALANEANSTFHRMAFGNGGSYVDAAGNIVFNSPNDGSESGWESRLYNETYSEIIDETDANFKTDPGSADINVVRPGGGAVPSDDPDGGGVVSLEVGKKSNIIITLVLNKNEPKGQLLSQDLGVSTSEEESYFMFNEIGLYSPGKPAKSTPGYSTVSVGDKISTDVTTLLTSTPYNISVDVDGVNYTAVITTPVTGTGPSGQITFGDLCEGINTGDWITSGELINSVVFVYITDRSGGTYPSILTDEGRGLQSFGALTFQSLSVGETSEVILNCTASLTNIFNVLTNGICDNCNATSNTGGVAGVANNSIITLNERERLLTHFIFSPILKSKDRALEIVYELTVSVTPGVSSTYTNETTPTPTVSPTPTVTGTPTPTVSNSVTGTPTPTPTPTPTKTPTPTPSPSV